MSVLESSLNRHNYEASSWLRKREERYYELGILSIFILLLFTITFLIFEIFAQQVIWWQGLLIMFLAFLLALAFLLGLAYISEKRIDYFTDYNPYLSRLLKHNSLPGFYIVLRSLNEFDLIGDYVKKKGLSENEIEIMERLAKDGSMLSLEELSDLAKNLLKIS